MQNPSEPCSQPVFENLAEPTLKDRIKIATFANMIDSLGSSSAEKIVGNLLGGKPKELTPSDIFGRANAMYLSVVPGDYGNNTLSNLLTCTGPNSLGLMIVEAEARLRRAAAVCGSKEAAEILKLDEANPDGTAMKLFLNKSPVCSSVSVDVVEKKSSVSEFGMATVNEQYLGALSFGLKPGKVMGANSKQCAQILLRYGFALGAIKGIESGEENKLKTLAENFKLRLSAENSSKPHKNLQ